MTAKPTGRAGGKPFRARRGKARVRRCNFPLGSVVQMSRFPTFGKPRLRRARAGDGPGCYDVFYRAVHDGTDRFYGPDERQAWAPSPAPPADFEDRLLRQHTVVAARNGIVGFMSLGADGHLDLAYVAPDWMGRGVACGIYDRILRDATRQGLPVLTTDASFLFRKFLLRRGWTTRARQSVIREGVAITNFRMQLTGHL